MYIDIDSVYDKGVDYLVKISWNEDKKTWQEEITEHFSNQNERTSSQKVNVEPTYRTIFTFDNYTNFFK